MENLPTYRLTQSGPEAQEILNQVNLNTIDIEQLKRLYQALNQSEPEIIEPTDTWPVANPEENVIYRVIDRVNTPPQYYSDYMWNGSTMVLMSQYNNAIDNEPTANSNNLVKSGGVYSFVHANGGAYDISAAHAVGGVLATYDDLADALGTNGANVPAAVRKGGMSIKYVSSSDNKYVQYRLMSDSFNTTPANWQGVDDEPTSGSKNLITSDAVATSENNLEKEIDAINDVVLNSEIINQTGQVGELYVLNGKLAAAASSYNILYYYFEDGEHISLEYTSTSNNVGDIFLADSISDIAVGYVPSVVFQGKVPQGESTRLSIDVPSGKYLCVSVYSGSICNVKRYTTGKDFNDVYMQYDVNTSELVALCAADKVSGGLNASGQLVSASFTYTCKDFIKVIPNSYLSFFLRTFKNLAIAFYSDKNEASFISGIAAPSQNPFSGSAFVPSNAHYMKFSATDWTGSQYVIANLAATNEIVKNFKQSRAAISGAVVKEGYYINNSGVEIALYGTLYYTLPVVEGETLTMLCGVPSIDGSLCLAFFDEDDVYIAGSAISLAQYEGQEKSFNVPHGAYFAKVSFNVKYRDKIYCNTNYSRAFKEQESNVSIVGLTITSAQTIETTNAPFCAITKSTGTRVKGVGTTTLTLTFADTIPSGTVYTYGVKIPYSTQDVAIVSLNGNAIVKPLATEKTKSGKAYQLQGETYQRVNQYSQGITTNTITITTDNVSDEWELWISDKAVIGDTMPLTPICYIYDGGHWDGHVLYNGVEMSIWTLHRTLGIPYTIAQTGNASMQQEVIDDIESGFAELITRVGGHNNTLYKQVDNLVIEGIIAECREHESDNMGVVLATHAFDKDVIRCLKMAGLKFVRTAPTFGDIEKFGTRFGDYDLPLINCHSVNDAGISTSVFMGFPVILWAHGIGDPQSAEEQELSAFYGDKSSATHTAGQYTIAGMEHILLAQASGRAATMKSSEWIAFCEKYK